MINAVFVAGGGSLPDRGNDLQITKTDGLSNPVAGQGITDRLDRRIAATSAVAHAVVNDGMPANLRNLTGTSTVR